MAQFGTDEQLSASKIAPLESNQKRGVQHDDSQGVIGDEAPGQAKLRPIETAEEYKHTLPHVKDGGVAGADETLESSKLQPLEGRRNETTAKSALRDEPIDATRIAPLGSQREPGDSDLKV